MNFLTAKISPTATHMLRMDHTHVMAQFHKLELGVSDTVRGAVVRSICAALEIHAQLEEEIFYPALRQAGVQSPALEKSTEEHAEMKRIIERVRSLKGQRAAQDDAVCELMNGVMHHVADEETQLLPAAEKFLRPDRLSELGAQMTSRRLQLARPRAAELAADLVKAAPVKTAAVTVGALLAGSMLIGALRRSQRTRMV